jgi:hypothetical protein
VQSIGSTLHQSIEGKQALTGAVEKRRAKMLAGHGFYPSRTIFPFWHGDAKCDRSFLGKC